MNSADAPTASANVEHDLRALTRYLAESGHEAAHGALGGDWGYGAEVNNATFEMHPFWWGDCECGHEDAYTQWDEDNPHADSCYQTALDKREDDAEAAGTAPWDVAPQLTKEWGLPYEGCAVHCTCGNEALRQQWIDTHDHDSACPTVRPNFRHKSSGFEVRWYKYIGRDTETNWVLDGRQWADMFDECVQSVLVVTT